MTFTHAEQCAHEAAHAVVASAMGMSVCGIRLSFDSRNRSDMQTAVLPPLEWSDDSPRLWRAMALMALAGDVAVPGSYSRADQLVVEQAMRESAELGVALALDDLRTCAEDILARNTDPLWRLNAFLQIHPETMVGPEQIAECVRGLSFTDEPEYHI